MMDTGQVSLTAAESFDKSFMPIYGHGANLDHRVNRLWWRAHFAGQFMSSFIQGMAPEDVEPDSIAEASITCADALILRLRVDNFGAKGGTN